MKVHETATKCGLAPSKEKAVPQLRAGSPPLGFSTLITSTPSTTRAPGRRGRTAARMSGSGGGLSEVTAQILRLPRGGCQGPEEFGR